MEPIEKQALLDEIVALSEIQNIRAGDITIKEYMKTAKCGRSAAIRELYLLVEKGTMHTTMVRGMNGKHTRVFRKVQHEEET